MVENSFQPFTRRQTMIRRDFEIYRYRYMDEVELHHHDFYEIYMLLRGSVSYTVENRIFHMRAGDLMLISPLELHQARVDSNDEPYERIVLWVDRGYLESLSSPHTSLTRCFDTTVPGHTNLLRLPGPRSAEMRRELAQPAHAGKLWQRPAGRLQPGGADGCHQSERGGPQHAERAFGRYGV